MELIKTILIDDEDCSIIDLKEALLAYPDIQIAQCCYTGKEGLEAINRLKPDLVFVDIEMPVMNGFEMLSKLEHIPVIIFCTGFAEYAIKGYEYDPADFVPKPVDPKRFESAIKKAYRDLEQKNTQARLLEQQRHAGYLWLEYRDLHGDARKVHVYPPQIILIKTEDGNPDYIEYFLEDQSHHTLKKSLKRALEELSPTLFLRVHNSFIINQQKIKAFHNNSDLFLEGFPQPVPVSRSYRKALKSVIKAP